MNDNQILDEVFFEKNKNDNSEKIGVETISIPKFIVLSIVTFTLYPIWWTYKAWKFFKIDQNFDISPVLRTIFGIFYNYDLFEKVKRFAQSNGYQGDYSSLGLFIGILVLNLISQIPNTLISLIGFLVFVLYIPVVQAFNFGIQNSKNYYPIEQSGLNTRQITLVVICLLLWALCIFGTFFGEEDVINAM